MSIGSHALIVALAVLTTLHGPAIASDFASSEPLYIAAPDRMVAQKGVAPTDQRLIRKAEKPSTGEVRRAKNESSRDTVALAGDPKIAEHDRAATQATAQSAGDDSVYSVLDVDTAVVRLATSAVPVYPPVLAAANIQGYVTAHYVVDTTGLADTSTFVLLESTNPGFLHAVRDALPHMRFAPAMIGSRKVRQSVLQQFVFRIKSNGSVLTVTMPPRRFTPRGPPRFEKS